MRSTLLLFLCCLISLSVQAQRFQSGFIGGISTSQVSGDYLGGFHKAGLKLGAFVKHDFTASTAGQFSLYYIDKGSNATKSNYQIDLSYVETAWSFQKKYGGFIYEGSLLFAALIDGTTYDAYGYEDPYQSEYSKIDLGIQLGMGRKISRRMDLFWELSNSIPFTPIQAHASGETYLLNKGKYNAVLSFSFRYLLGNK